MRPTDPHQDSTLLFPPKKSTGSTPAPLPRRSKAPWIIGGAVGLAGLWFWMNPAKANEPALPGTDPPGTDPPPDPAPKPGAEEKDPKDFLAETNACIDVTNNKPGGYLGRVRPLGTSDADWYALVGYWMAYPLGPVQPKGTAYADALARIAACVKEKLGAQPKPDPPPKPEIKIPPVIVFGPNAGNTFPKPTPNGFYTIVGGDNPSAVTKAAYGQEGPHNLKAMRAVMDHPYNLRFRVMVENEKNFFPKGRISFVPMFGNAAEQVADSVGAGRDLPGSNNFATFYFPPTAEVLA